MNWLDMFLVSYAALWVITALTAVILLATLRTMGMVLVRLPRAAALVLDEEGPKVGAHVDLTMLESLQSDSQADRTPLLFLSTSCILCRRLAPGIGALWAVGVRLHVLVKGEPDDASKLIALLGPDASRFARNDNESFDRIGIEATPFALIVDAAGRVREKGLVNNLQQLEGLIFDNERSSLDDASLA